MKKIIFFLLAFNSYAMLVNDVKIESFNWDEQKKLYRVILVNRPTTHLAEKSMLQCLQKGLKEKVELDVDIKNAKILSCK